MQADRPPYSLQERIPSTREEIDRVMSTCLEQLEAHGHDDAGVFAIRLAMEEALSNAMSHGNGGDASKLISIEVEITSGQFTASVADEGPGYDPVHVPDPTADENLSIASGRGLALIRSFMTEVTLVPPGNCIQMRYVPGGPSCASS